MEDLTAKIDSAVAEAEWQRERNAVQIALESTLPRLHNRKTEICTIFDTMKIKAAMEEVLIILGSEIAESVRGIMIGPEYSQKASAKQTLYVYTGTHWEVVITQIYYDFVKEACRRIGLSEVYVQNPDFMNKVFEKVAFIVSHHISTAQPHDGVWINLRNCTVEICPSPSQSDTSPKGEGVITNDQQSTKHICSPLGEVARSDGEGLPFIITTHEHRPEDFFLYCLPYSYDPDAECPRWLKFLDEVLPDESTQTLLGEYIGYCFTQNMKLERMAVFYGGGANGKSVCMDVVKKLFGRTNISEATLSSITNDPEARTLLENKLVNISSESGRNLNSAILKMLISGEPVEMRKLYVGTKQLYNPPKLITSYNELPAVENTHGYRRRWILFPFNKTIADNMQDPALVGKLATELPGILNWVLKHLQALVERVNKNVGEAFSYSKECSDAANSYFKASNSVTMFLDECCKKDESVTLKLKDVYQFYKSYCTETGINRPAILKNFKKGLIEWGATLSIYADVIYVNVVVDRSVYA